MAKPKTKPKPHGQKPEPLAGSSSHSAEDSVQQTPADELNPVRPQPFLFKVSLALFVGWLLFLAYVAYRVMFS